MIINGIEHGQVDGVPFNMSFLLDTSILGDINPMHLLLAAGMILVIAFYIYKTKFANNSKNAEQNEEVADVVPVNNANDDGFCADFAKRGARRCAGNRLLHGPERRSLSAFYHKT